MGAIQQINDSNWQTTIGTTPALILLTTGNGLRGDFSTQFKKSAQEHNNILFLETNPAENPQLAEQFNAKEKPVLIGYFDGDVLVRRVRPWGTDIVLALELLNEKRNKKQKEQTPMTDNARKTTDVTEIPNNKPVNVTDNDFQELVVDYSNEMPVLVDFWAEWCGPCRMVAPIMETLANEYAGQIRVAKVDTDANPGLSQAFRIMSIPTVMFFKDGQLVFSQPGAFPEEAFRDLTEQVLALDVQKAIAEAEAQKAAEGDEA